MKKLFIGLVMASSGICSAFSVNDNWASARADLKHQVSRLIHLGKDIYADYYVDAVALEGELYNLCQSPNMHKVINHLKESNFKAYLPRLMDLLLSDNQIVAVGEYKGKMKVSANAQIIKLELKPILKRFLSALGLPEDFITL